MKIATYNINNIRKRLPNLLSWLETARADVICLQELKSADAEFPSEALADAGYHAVWQGQRSWNGVAILARGGKPVPVRYGLPGDDADRQARYIEAAVGGVLIACLYAPNGNPCPGPKFDYKLRWLDRLATQADSLLAAGVPAVLAGDYNVAPEPVDVYPTTSYDGDALTRDESRARFRRLLDAGWTDAVRACRPEGPAYTFWDYRRRRWDRDAGLRLDHLLLAGGLERRLEEVGIDRDARAAEGASDHAPVWVRLGP